MKIFATFFTVIFQNEDSTWVKAVEKNISRHKNGTLHVRVRREGQLFTNCPQPKDLKEARRKVEAEDLDSLLIPQTAREPTVPLPEHVEAKVAVVNVVTLKNALEPHAAGMLDHWIGRPTMAVRCVASRVFATNE